MTSSAAVEGESTDEIEPSAQSSVDDADLPNGNDQSEPTPDADDTEADKPNVVRRGGKWKWVLVFGVIPALSLLLAAAAGYLKWFDSSARSSEVAAIESVQAATDSTMEILSYQPDTVKRDLAAARHRLTGTFRDAYTSLTEEVVIPGSKEKKISAAANVTGAGSVSASETHAVVLLFVNQTIVVGDDPPTGTASAVRVTLDKIDGRWLISDFTPV